MCLVACCAESSYVIRDGFSSFILTRAGCRCEDEIINGTEARCVVVEHSSSLQNGVGTKTKRERATRKTPSNRYNDNHRDELSYMIQSISSPLLPTLLLISSGLLSSLFFFYRIIPCLSVEARAKLDYYPSTSSNLTTSSGIYFILSQSLLCCAREFKLKTFLNVCTESSITSQVLKWMFLNFNNKKFIDAFWRFINVVGFNLKKVLGLKLQKVL